MTLDRSEPPIQYTATAADQVVALFDYYEAKERPAAMSSLLDTLESAWRIIVGAPDGGMPAPTPYPQVARKGVRWLHVGSYWIAFRQAPRLTIAAVFHDRSDIPGRYQQQGKAAW